MQTRLKRSIAAAAALVVATVGTVVAFTGSGSAAATPSLQAYGITSDGTRLLTFLTNNPARNDWVRRVTGLTGSDTALIGIDFRVQDGKLYGVGNYGGIYTIAIPDATMKKVSQLSVALKGSMFGVDFNPAANRLRVISDTGQNLRHNIDDGSTAGQTIEDTPLTTVGVSGTATGVTGAAYTNNDLNGTTATTLFDIDTYNDQVSIQSPANNGTLAPTGKLGVDAGLNTGFDIYSDLSSGKTLSNTAFAVITAGTSGIATFYTVEPLTGAATRVDDFPLDVGDVAVALDTY